MDPHRLLGFVAAVTPLSLIPGTSFALVSRNVIAGSRRDGARVALGTVCGLLVHATFAAVGLSALVMASARALTAVKLAGAVYLVWLGISTWRSAKPSAPPARRRAWRPPWAGLGGFGQGLWSNVLNPKAASVYLTLVPQFLSPRAPVAPQIAALAAAHATVVMTWLLILTTVVATARDTFQTPRFRSLLTRATGAVLIALGVRTAAA
ncbi:LysE family translocator [Streptomyces sp. NPDC058157]|uniref:LysE family translocator n=1 Tax=Streptomyces sp. NPDC058157 TaxID=3346360 RepID=UPI0036E73997